MTTDEGQAAEARADEAYEAIRVERALAELDGILRREFLVVNSPGWPGGIGPWPQTEDNARAFVAEHGGTLRTRLVSDWEDA